MKASDGPQMFLTWADLQPAGWASRPRENRTAANIWTEPQNCRETGRFSLGEVKGAGGTYSEDGAAEAVSAAGSEESQEDGEDHDG